MWDGERVKEEAVELTEMVWEESPAHPPSVAQGAVTWRGLSPLECRALLAAEGGPGVSG